MPKSFARVKYLMLVQKVIIYTARCTVKSPLKHTSKDLLLFSYELNILVYKSYGNKL